MPQHLTRSGAARRPVQFPSALSGVVLEVDGTAVQFAVDGLPGVYEGTLLLVPPVAPARGTVCLIVPTTSRRSPGDPQLDAATTWVIPTAETGSGGGPHDHAGVYDPVGAAASGDTAHVQATDPHGQYVEETDARLSDQRVPTDASVTSAKVAAGAAIAESKLSLASDAAAGTASRRTLGTAALQAAAGNHGHGGPAGIIAVARMTASVTGTTTVAVTLLTSTFTVAAGRRTSVEMYASGVSCTAVGDVVEMTVLVDGAVRQIAYVVQAIANRQAELTPRAVLDGLASGAHDAVVRIVRVVGSGNVNVTASAAQPAELVVEDCGPI